MAKRVKRSHNHLGDVDILIVGGGPAGSSTALHLQQLNPELARRVLMLDKHHHPRDKPCGGALTLHAERILAELGIVADIRSAPVRHVRLQYGDASIDLPEDGCAKRVIRRCDFDALLFRTAQQRGLRAEQGVCVTGVTRHPQHLEVATDRGYYRAAVVVSADGVNAVLRRTPGFGPGRMARIYEAETPADPALEPVFTKQLLSVDLSYIREGLCGYYWDFPCYIGGRPYVSRGIVAGSRLGSRAYFERILSRRGVSLDGAIRTAWPIRHFDPRERLSQPRMLLVGDAMGADPLFSEGISQGLAGGRLVAEALDDGFGRNDLSFATYTKAVHRSRFGRELLAYARAARSLYGRHSELLLSALHRSPELCALIGHSYAGTANIYDRIGQVARIVAGHLWNYRRNIGRFRRAADVERVLAGGHTGAPLRDAITAGY